MTDYSYAVTAYYGPAQVAFRYSLPEQDRDLLGEWDTAADADEVLEQVAAALSEASRHQTPLSVVGQHGGAIVVVPGPGMFFVVHGPWDHYMAAEEAVVVEGLERPATPADARALMGKLSERLDQERNTDRPRHLVVDALTKQIAKIEELLARAPAVNRDLVVPGPMPAGIRRRQ